MESVKALVDSVDWTDREDMTCVCRQCSNQFRSPSKFIFGAKPTLVSKKPCPNCGCRELSRAGSDPEQQVIG